jgi:hypothetical protein
MSDNPLSKQFYDCKNLYDLKKSSSNIVIQDDNCDISEVLPQLKAYYIHWGSIMIQYAILLVIMMELIVIIYE